MSRLQSQIPRLRPASSYHNLSQIGIKPERPLSHHGSRQNLHINNMLGTERTSMINTPTPVTHRRMFQNNYLSKPPWAIDETISPFDREPEKKRQPRNERMRISQSEHGSQSNYVRPVSIRLESPSISSEFIQDNLQRDEYDRINSPFDNESYYKSEIQRYIIPPIASKQVSASQTDIIGTDLNYVEKFKHKSFQPIKTSNIMKPEKKLVLPLKELKRTNNKNNLTYKVVHKHSSNNEPVDFNKVFNVQDRLTNQSDEEIQSRIDYWLNKSISLNPVNSEKSSNSGVRTAPNSPDKKKPIFRNQITFTPRPMNNQYSENGNSHNSPSYASNPQIIEAVIFQSDSESEKDYIVSSRSMENKTSRPNSHFTIRANLASKSNSPNNEVENSMRCEVCSKPILKDDQMNYCEIRCHKNCFKCFWCKKKLRIDNYKININKLCCPLHYRLLSN